MHRPPAQRCVLATRRRKRPPGIVDWCAISMRRPGHSIVFVCNIAKKHCHQALPIGMPYQGTGPQHSIVYVGNMAKKTATRFLDWGANQCTGPQHSIACVGHMAKKTATRICGLVCHLNAQVPQHSNVFVVRMAEEMPPGLWDWCVTTAPRSPAQPCALAAWQRKGPPGSAD